MNRVMMPSLQVGNDFIVPKSKNSDMKVEVLAPEAYLPPQILEVATDSSNQIAEANYKENFNESNAEAPDASSIDDEHQDQSTHTNKTSHGFHIPRVSAHGTEIFKRYPVATGALIFLVAGAAIINLGARYWTASHITNHASAATIAPERQITGLNLTVPQADFQNKLQSITSQTATLTVGANIIPVGSDTIRNWLQVTSNKSKSEYYIHLNRGAIAGSLSQLANKFVKTPVNQVTVSEDGADRMVVAGRNGTSLSDPSTLTTQAQVAAKTVMDGKGLQFNTPLQTVPFQAVTAANFDKLLVADITTKKMWAYQNGQVIKTFLTSDGAPATPTPLGQYKVYAKFAVQDMRGTNPNGKPYFQPRVPWVSYFTAGNAVHGVYWHPDSWFGVNNSSHGCVGTKVDDAKWVYDWAPVGTTVITHA